MALKYVKVILSTQANATLFTNSSNAYLLIIGVSFSLTGACVLYVADPQGKAVDNVIEVIGFGESLSVSGDNTFSTTATSATGIENTTESVNESVSGLTLYIQVLQKKSLIPPNYNLVASGNISVSAFVAIQADSLEDLRGFL